MMRSRRRWGTGVLTVVLTLALAYVAGCSKKSNRTVVVGMTCLSVNPSTGPMAGGTTVMVSGSLFQSGATVLFGGAGATAVSVDPGGTQITCQTPAGSPGPVEVAIWNPDGTGCRIVDGFVYTGAGALSCGPCFSLSVRCAPVAGGDIISIACDCGAGFDASTTVSVGGWPLTPNFISSCELEVTTPPLAPGTHDVEVCDAWGCRTFVGGLVVPACGTGGMGVCSIVPASADRTGGSMVTINGCGFAVGGVEVYFGGSPVLNLTAVSATSISVTIPPSCPEVVDVTVVDPSSTAQATLTRGFEYLPGLGDPVLASVTPAFGPVGGGNPVTLGGTDFTLGSNVYFGTLAAVVTSESSASINCVAPAAASPGRVDVVVEDVTTGCTTVLECGYEYQ